MIGCYNRPPFKDQVLYGIDSYSGQVIKVVIPSRGNPECQYQHSPAGRVDSKCTGCSHRGSK